MPAYCKIRENGRPARFGIANTAVAPARADGMCSTGLRLTFAAAAMLALVSCEKPPPPPVTIAIAEPRIAEQEQRYAQSLPELIAEGEKVLPSLDHQQDARHNTAWFKGAAPGDRSAAYLYCGRIGDGAPVLRFVVRHIGASPINLKSCSVSVSGRDLGTFAPTKISIDRLPGGNAMEVADIPFDTVRPMVLAILGEKSAEIGLLGANGRAQIRLDETQINEMRKVLAAYEYLNASSQ